jgi:HEPN domain-containing protein/predicted nucleotidyltransferase
VPASRTPQLTREEKDIILAIACGFSSLGNFPIGLRELGPATGLSASLIARGLERLGQEGIVERCPRGKYRLRESPARFFKDFQRSCNAYLIAKARSIAEEISKSKAVEMVCLLGGVARGEGRPTSDLDTLIVLKHRDEAEEKKISKAISEISARLGVAVDPSFISVKGVGGLRRARKSIESLGGLVLYEKSVAGGSRRGAVKIDSKKASVFLRTAEEHLRSARVALTKKIYYDCVHHSVRAAENAADAFIVGLGGVAPHACHDSEAMRGILCRTRPELLHSWKLKRAIAILKRLEKHAVKSSFPIEVSDGVFVPPTEFYGKGFAEGALRDARWLVKLIRRLLGAQR